MPIPVINHKLENRLTPCECGSPIVEYRCYQELINSTRFDFHTRCPKCGKIIYDTKENE